MRNPFRKRGTYTSVPGGPEGDNSVCTDVGEPACNQGIPVGVFPGYRGESPHAIVNSLPGAVSNQYDDSPVTFARYSMGRGIHDVQLSNGWQRTNYGQRTVYASSGYLNEVVPQIPGQSRLYGGQNPANFVPRGPAPGQWQNVVNQVQSQPTNPGGPGQFMGTIGLRGAGG